MKRQAGAAPGIRVDDGELELLGEEAGLELAKLEALEWQHELLVLLLHKEAGGSGSALASGREAA